MSMYTERDAKTIIRAYYGEGFKFRITTGCQIGVRPTYETAIGLPTLAWRRLAPGKDSAVAVGAMVAGGGIDWQWAAESRQLTKAGV